MRELCIKNGTILTMDSRGSIIANGALLTRDSRIAYVGPAKDMPPAPQARVLDAKGGLILPGFINCHTHAAMTLLRGLADDLPLETWLTEHIFPAERNLTAQAVYWGTLLGCAEMIKSGTTSFCDMYLFAFEAARAADAAGLRAVVGEVIYDFPSPSYGELDNGFKVSEELIRTYQDHPRISGAVMPHALYTCSPPLLERAGRLAADLDADINIHLAETKVETKTVLERYGRRPLAHLQDMGMVNSRLWVDHAVDLNQGEMEAMAGAGVRVALLPESNMKLASGLADLPAMLSAGIKTGLGTDGCASNNDLDMLGEMASLAKVHKAVRQDPSLAPAMTVLELATRRAGEVFGQADLGYLAPGALADLIVVDLDRPHLTPLYNPVSQLVYAAQAGDVIHSVCHGRVLMEDRVLTTIDEEEVVARALEESARMTGREAA